MPHKWTYVGTARIFIHQYNGLIPRYIPAIQNPWKGRKICDDDLKAILSNQPSWGLWILASECQFGKAESKHQEKEGSCGWLRRASRYAKHQDYWISTTFQGYKVPSFKLQMLIASEVALENYRLPTPGHSIYGPVKPNSLRNIQIAKADEVGHISCGHNWNSKRNWN